LILWHGDSYGKSNIDNVSLIFMTMLCDNTGRGTKKHLTSEEISLGIVLDLML